MVNLERPLDATCLDEEILRGDGAVCACGVVEDIDRADLIFVYLKGLTCGLGEVSPGVLSGCLVSALCPYLAVLVDDFVAVRPVGADGVALASGVPAEVELILGDREVVLTIVDKW